MYTSIKYEVTNRIAYLTLARPEKRNAFDGQLVEEIKTALHQAAVDQEVKILVLRSEGAAFCAGADLAYLQQLQGFTLEQNQADSLALKDMFEKLYMFPKVTIAQVQGHALAGGCGLATACDFCYAVPEALFGYTEVKIGFVPALVMVYLVKKIGEGKARELLLTGKLVSAEKAERMGLINEVVSPEELENKVNELAKNLCQQASAQSLEHTKCLIHEVREMSLSEAFTHAALSNAQSRMSEDCKRGISAFLNKEKLEW